MTPVPTDLPALPTPEPPANSPHLRECARYELDDVTRVLCTRVAAGQTVLIDMLAKQFDCAEKQFDCAEKQFDCAEKPLDTEGSYVVEPQLSSNEEELVALVTDYLNQVAVHQRLPMSVRLLAEFLETDPT
jgi:hypothetical protein